MRRRGRSATLLAFAVSAGLLGVAASAWACVPMANLAATPTQVRAGEEVTVSGIRFVGFGPVTIRLNALDGPVLATAPMGPTSNTIFKTSVVIPPGTPPGQLVLLAMQEPEPGGLVPWGVPARTLVTVTAPDGSAPPPAPPAVLAREPGLARATVSTTALVLVGLGVAVAAFMVAGALALVAGRKASPVADRAPEQVR